MTAKKALSVGKVEDPRFFTFVRPNTLINNIHSVYPVTTVFLDLASRKSTTASYGPVHSRTLLRFAAKDVGTLTVIYDSSLPNLI